MSEYVIDLQKIKLLLQKIGRYCLSLNYWPYCLMLTAVFTIKSGVRGVLPWGDFQPVSNFPRATQSFSSNSYGLIILSKLFKVNQKESFFLLNLTLLILSVLLLFIYLKSRFRTFHAKFLILAFLSSPIYVVLIGNIGRHDLLTIMGTLMFLLSQNTIFKLLAILIACLGSPEHTFAAFMLYLLGSFVLKKKGKFKSALFAVIFSGLYTIVSSIWAKHSADGQSRFNNILTQPEFVTIGLRNFINNFLLEWYSYFSYFWILIIIAILLHDKKIRLKIGILLAFTMCFNLIMVDKTRDFVVAIIPLAILLLQPIFKYIAGIIDQPNKAQKDLVMGIFLLTALISPAIEITFEGQPRAPHSWLITKLLESFS
ncbi:MAG: hypothetical protein FJX80_05720 [Bacteroidetes bacterium]|nr:hypothetical protein [Bacteroidota bacterium]